MRTPPSLPADLKAGLDRLSDGLSRNAIAERAATQSCHYRAGGGSQVIGSEADALAYAFARMPATYAATVAVLDALRDALPQFAPSSALDVGAGPGTASFAAAAVFAAIQEFRSVDANACLRALALTLLAGAKHEALRRAKDGRAYRCGDALALLGDTVPADLVIASYMAGEIPDRELSRLANALWAATAGALAVIEPGTPAGYARIIRMRDE